MSSMLSFYQDKNHKSSPILHTGHFIAKLLNHLAVHVLSLTYDYRLERTRSQFRTATMRFQWIVAVLCLRDTETSLGTKAFDLLHCVFIFHSNVLLNTLRAFFTLGVREMYRYCRRISNRASVYYTAVWSNCSPYIKETKLQWLAGSDQDFSWTSQTSGWPLHPEAVRLNILCNSQSLRVPQEELQSFGSLQRPAEPLLPADPLMCGRKSEFK